MPSFSTHLTRLLQGLFTLLLTLFGLLLVTFSLSALSPVDRVLQIVGDHASQSTYDQVSHQLGLDQPLPVQFWHYLVNLAHGDLGIASATGQPVLHDLLAVFPATLELATLALIVGAVLGIVAGVLCARYAGSPWDLAVRTFTLLGNSVPIFWLGLLMLALFSWTGVARIVRAQTLTLKERDFVIAAKTLGVSHVKIILKHIIPNMTTQIIVAASLSIAGAILDESALSYLGYGVALPKASWGSMLQNAQQYILYDPLLALIPGMFILLTVLCFNILGDALQYALDPRLHK